MDVFPENGVVGEQPPWELTNFHPISRHTATQVSNWYKLWVLELGTDHGKKQNAFLTPFRKTKTTTKKTGCCSHQEKNGSHGLGFYQFQHHWRWAKFLSDLGTWLSAKCGLELWDLFFPLNVYLKIRKKKVASEVANPIWSPKPKVYTEFLSSCIHCPNEKFYQHCRQIQGIMLHWLLSHPAPDFGVDTSASTCPSNVSLQAPGRMLMNWVYCLFNFRSGSSLRETLIISRLNVYPGKWRSRTLKVSIWA